MTISPAIVPLLDFCVTKKPFACVGFVVSDKVPLDDCVDSLGGGEFQHYAGLSSFAEDDFLQSLHVDDFFRSQSGDPSCICINRRLNDDRRAAAVTESESAGPDQVHQDPGGSQLHPGLGALQPGPLRVMAEEHHVLLADGELHVPTTEVLKSQNSVHRRVRDGQCGCPAL